MSVVLVTGASSGIGRAVCEFLLSAGHEVYGIGRDFSGWIYESSQFHKIECDLISEGEPEKVIGSLKGVDFDVLINNAGCAYYGLHETVSPSSVREITRTNLEVPMIITGLLLRSLKERGGLIINVASVCAISSSNPHGAAYGASKAGLLSFSRSIFDEGRKHGLRVSCIMPDMTATSLYRNASFDVEADEPLAYLSASDVAGAVEFIMTRPEGVVVPEVVLKPQLHRIGKK